MMRLLYVHMRVRAFHICSVTERLCFCMGSDASFMFVDRFVALDHLEQRCWAVCVEPQSQPTAPHKHDQSAPSACSAACVSHEGITWLQAMVQGARALARNKNSDLTCGDQNRCTIPDAKAANASSDLRGGANETLSTPSEPTLIDGADPRVLSLLDTLASTDSAVGSERELIGRELEPPAQHPRAPTVQARFRVPRVSYVRSIERCLEQIVNGESYELCLTNQVYAFTSHIILHTLKHSDRVV